MGNFRRPSTHFAAYALLRCEPLVRCRTSRTTMSIQAQPVITRGSLMLKVMIAEDDLLMADMLADVLIESGYEVCGIARTVEEGVELGERHKPDLALLDLRLAAGGLGTE